MTDYYVGQKVVCVRDGWVIPPGEGPLNTPQRGVDYVIRTIETGEHGLSLRFHWLINHKYHYLIGGYAEPQFALHGLDGVVNFVPLVERESKTDISVLKKLLVPGTKVLETVD